MCTRMEDYDAYVSGATSETVHTCCCFNVTRPNLGVSKGNRKEKLWSSMHARVKSVSETGLNGGGIDKHSNDGNK